MKKKLAIITPSAVFKAGKRRRLENVECHSGWMQIDIDPADNPGLHGNANVWRDEIVKLKNVAFAGLSTRGNGVWGLIRIKYPERLADHHIQLVQDFQSIGINLDTTKGANWNDARFYSLDPDGRFANEYEAYDRLPRIVIKHKIRQDTGKFSIDSHFKGAITFAKNRGCTFTHGSDMHKSIFLFCSYLFRNGVPKHKAEAYIEQNLLPITEIRSNCITDAYNRNSKRQH